jgi:peptidoglycan/xylan/chitin deacetylase (PgdA/CDA1 family)
VSRGHELEDHTYSHIELRGAERKRGQQWVIADVNRCAEAIKAVTGTQPHYVRPPDWIISDDTHRDLERLGYHLLTISRENPIALRGVSELAVILLSGSEVPKYASALVDAFVLKLEASRGLLPTIAAPSSGIRYPKNRSRKGFSHSRPQKHDGPGDKPGDLHR